MEGYTLDCLRISEGTLQVIPHSYGRGLGSGEWLWLNAELLLSGRSFCVIR